MNLNTVWKEEDDSSPMDYFRAVSTGPATPFVLSATTVRDHLNLGISYRSAVFLPVEINSGAGALERFPNAMSGISFLTFILRSVLV